MTTKASNCKATSATGVRQSECQANTGFPLSHPIYTTGVRLKGFRYSVYGRNMDSRAGARVIRSLVTLDKNTHAEIVRYHRTRAEKLMAIWGCVVERAAQETFGRSLKFGEYQVCAIVRSEFSERHKRILRHCSYRATEHRDCAASHDFLSRRG